MPDEVKRQEGPRVLVALFFWRSLDLEGGAGLVATVAKELEHQGCTVTLLLPGRPIWLSPTMRTISYLARTPLGTLTSYLRRLREDSRTEDLVLLLENNPLSHLLLELSLPNETPTAVFISSPAVGLEILRLGLRRQYLAHLLGKSRALAGVLGRALGFRLPRYLVSTEYQREQLMRLRCAPQRVQTIAPGVDPAVFVPRPARPAVAGRLVVGYIGHFSPIKGVPDLVAAFAEAVRQRPEMELAIAWSGKGAEQKRVLEMIAAVPAPGRVRLLGRVDVAEFLGEVDVIVLPFRSPSIPHLPLVLLEAFAMGVPVVTSRVGGLPDAVIDGVTGFTFALGNRAELTGALLRLCDQPELRKRMRASILSDCPERFSTARFCRSLLDLARRGGPVEA